MAQSYPKKMTALCVGVLSGDRVLFQGPVDKQKGGFKQKILHLISISAPKVDPLTGNDEKFGYRAREYLRCKLVNQTVSFVIEKKVNEIELGYILHEGHDIVTDLLLQGLARLRSEKTYSENIEDYRAAQQQAQMAERGVWSQQSQPQGATRYLRKWQQRQFYDKIKGKLVKAVVEEIHPSKACLYFPQEGYIGMLQFSEVQVVVLSEKDENGQTRSNVKAIRSTLQSNFLQREVDVHISTYKEGMMGYIINSETSEDVRKILLLNGYAKLGKQAMKDISTKEFMQLKHVAQIALQNQKGLWKQQKVNKSQALNGKSYMGIVSEVNSGDSLTIYNIEKNDFNRIFLPNIRAPTGQQPFAYESKQALRKRAIGQKVRVETQFSRKVNVKKTPGDVGELKTFVFASVFDNTTNLSVYMLEQGYAILHTPQVEEDLSKYFEELRVADTKAREMKKNVHSNENRKAPHFNDLSGGKGKKIDSQKCKNMFAFLKDEPHLTGIIEIVLNGSRFKIRLNHQPVMIIAVLEGVRCLPNESEFAKASEQALQYSKLNANQRDIQLDLKKVNNKGIFHGRLFINKKDYAEELLEKGLAVCMGGRNKNTKYEDLESFARKNKIGLWKYGLNLTSLRGQIDKQYRAVDFQRKTTLLQIISTNEFYLQTNQRAKPQVPQQIHPVGNVNIGEIYSARFTDDVFYRARILKELPGGKYYLQYVDYGNYDRVEKKNIGMISEELRKVKSSLYRCSLFGVEGVTVRGEELFKEYIGAELVARFKEASQPGPKEDAEFKVLLLDKNQSINLRLIEFGEAQCSEDDEQWRRVQELARKNKQGKWAHDEDE